MVKITENYFLDSYDHGFIIKEKTIVQDKKSENYGKESYVVTGYYNSIESALSGLTNKELRKFIGKDAILELKDVKNKIKELNLFFEKELKIINGKK